MLEKKEKKKKKKRVKLATAAMDGWECSVFGLQGFLTYNNYQYKCFAPDLVQKTLQGSIGHALAFDEI